MDFNDLLVTKATQYGFRTAYTNLSKILLSFLIIHIPLALTLLVYYILPVILMKVWLAGFVVFFTFLLAVSAQLALDIYNGQEISLERLKVSLPLFLRTSPVAATLFLPVILFLLAFIFSSKIVALGFYLVGIFFGVRLSFAIFYALEGRTSLIQSLQSSWKVTQPYFLQLLFLHIALWVTWAFLGAVGFGIFPIFGLAHVYFYKQVSEPSLKFTQPPPYL